MKRSLAASCAKTFRRFAQSGRQLQTSADISKTRYYSIKQTIKSKPAHKNCECALNIPTQIKCSNQASWGGAPLRSRRGQGGGVSPLGSKALISQKNLCITKRGCQKPRFIIIILLRSAENKVTAFVFKVGIAVYFILVSSIAENYALCCAVFVLEHTCEHAAFGCHNRSAAVAFFTVC